MKRLQTILMILICFGCVQFIQAQDIISKGGTLTTNNYGSGFPSGENPPKVVDNNTETKFLLFNFTRVTIQWQTNAPAIAVQYTLTSANDAPERDPRDWKLEASQDGNTWTTLDIRTNEMFSDRGQTKTYSMSNTTAYNYYRIDITALRSGTTGGLFQLAEWRLLEGLPPAAPSEFKATAVSGGQVLTSWKDNSNNETGFIIERSVDGINFTIVGQTANNTNNYTDENAAINTTYYYRVKALNDFGTSVPSNISLAATPGVGGPVYDLTNDGGTLENGRYLVQYGIKATPGGEKAEMLIDNNFNSKYLIFTGTPPDRPATADYWVQYQAVKEAVLTYYTITSANDAPERDPKNWELSGSNDGLNWTVLDTRSGELFSSRFLTRSFVLNNNRTRYTYYRWHVTANNGATNIAGQIGEWQLFGYDPNVPLPPKNLQVTAVTDTTMTMTWQESSTTETGFEIARSEDSLLFVSVGNVAANIITYTDKELLPGFKYFYRVRAMSTAGNSFWSNIASDTTTIDPRLPLTPRALTATGISETKIELKWQDRSDNERKFMIERSLDNKTFTLIDSVNAGITVYTDTARLKASRYYYRVWAINGFGKSYFSNTAEGTTQGKNEAPSFGNIGNVTTCKLNNLHTIAIDNILPGSESWQVVTLSTTNTGNDIIDSVSVSSVTSGKAELKFKTRSKGGTATITVKAKDDGKTYNGGDDDSEKSFTVTVNPLPVVISVPSGKIIPRFQQVTLTASGAESYVWTASNGIISGANSPSLVIKPTLNNVYTVIGSNAQGCSNTASVAIQIAGNERVEAVNVLTPNGDGKNDKWIIWNIGKFTGNEVMVFDRAGRIVFRANNYSNDWDGTYKGKPLEEGVYMYVIKPGLGIQPVKGTLTIIHDRK